MNKFNLMRKKRRDPGRQYMKAPDEMLIGVVSRLDVGKGLIETLGVAEKLREWKIQISDCHRRQRDGWRSRNERNPVKMKFANAILRDHVQLAGHRSDIEAVIASLDVLLMPSPAETFGRVLIEAMASGAAVVACKGGGVANIVRHEVRRFTGEATPGDPRNG